MIRSTCIALVLLALLAASAAGTTWIVSTAGTGDYTAIGAAVGSPAVASGDTILVMPGVYSGAANRDIDFAGKNLVLCSQGGPDVTVIDCGNESRAFYIHSGEPSSATVEGFTVRNGYADEGGGFFVTDSSSCTIRDCIIEDCSTTLDCYSGGGGICCRTNSDAFIYDCTLRDNWTHMFGGGALFMSGCEPNIEGCVFENNSAGISAGGVYIYADSDAIISGCTFIGNVADASGGGLLISLAIGGINDCTFYANTAGSQGGGICVYESALAVYQTIVSHSTDGSGIACASLTYPTDLQIHYCDVFGNADGDSLCGTYSSNLFVDPLYCDAAAGDLSLCSDSPCLPDGNDWEMVLGGIGEGCGACGSSVPEDETSWGAVKAMFR